MQECEGTGKNLEQAIDDALLKLKASREDVDIKILNEGGFLKKARVVVSISPDALEKYERKEKLKAEIIEEEKKTEPKKEKDDENFAETFMKKKIERNEKSKIQIITDVEEVKEEKTRKERKTVDAEAFLKDVLKSLSLEAEITKEEDDRAITFSINGGEELGALIGKHGEGMYALNSILLNVTALPKKVEIDINGYQKKHIEMLTTLAKNFAKQVSKSGKYRKLKPMNARDRRVIHTALQDDDRVTTMSKGEEPNRCVLIFPREYKDK